MFYRVVELHCHKSSYFRVKKYRLTTGLIRHLIPHSLLNRILIHHFFRLFLPLDWMIWSSNRSLEWNTKPSKFQIMELNGKSVRKTRKWAWLSVSCCLTFANAFLLHDQERQNISLMNPTMLYGIRIFSMRVTLSVGKWNYFLIGWAEAVHHIL